jgi:hypothetical protein
MDEQREAELAAKLIDADPPGREAPEPSKPALSTNQLAAIAREIATNVYEIPAILEKYDITQAQFAAHVYPNGYFQGLLKSYAAEWESIKSTNKRLAFQAAAALEESLPALAHRMGSKAEDFADAIGAAKLFTQLAGAGEKPLDTNAQGERFSIQINIGDRTVALTSSELAPPPQNAEVEGGKGPIQLLTDGEGDKGPIQLLTEGPPSGPTVRLFPARPPENEKI